MSDTVVLNVGGVYFWTRRATLASSSSFFSGLVASDATADAYFVDRDPTHFRHILNWIRGVRFLPDDDATVRELIYEADFYAMDDMRLQLTRTSRTSVPKMLKNILDELRQARAAS